MKNENLNLMSSISDKEDIIRVINIILGKKWIYDLKITRK